MTDTAMKEKTPTTRAQLSEWIRNHIQGQDEVDLDELTAAALKHFGSEKKFLQALLAEHMETLVHEIARRVLARTRGSAIPFGDKLVTEEGMQAAVRHSKFLRWMEHSGERHVALGKMRKIDLLEAARERNDRADAERRRADFLLKIASKLDDEQEVEDVLTEEDLEQLWEETETTDD